MYIGVSFKLYLSRQQTRDWCARAGKQARQHPATRSGQVQLVVFPSLPALEPAMQADLYGNLAWGAQDLFWVDRGAYTGAISGVDLADMGCGYAEIGHVEQRCYLGDTDEIIAAKVAAALRNQLIPWICVGESTQSSPRVAAQYCLGQLQAALSQIDEPAEIVLAYEPVWAIGQAQAASPAYVAQVIDGIKAGLPVAGAKANTAVIYGGSATPGSLTALGQGVDGLFLGRFAHDIAALEMILDEAWQMKAPA